MLGLLLPKFVLDEMKNPFEISSNTTISREVGDVVILFCDIADFDDIVKQHEDKIVEVLDKIIKRFDELCVLHGVQKIETVGKTYMAAGGLKQIEQSLPPDLKVLKPTARVLNLAKDMMSYIKESESLNLKIGIHVGQPVMGVIGYHKPQFSLIGDAVNTTSRHCTTGAKGRIMLSQSAFDDLDNFETLIRGYKYEVVDTEMKGKGIVKVYHIYTANNLFGAKIRSILERGQHQYLAEEQARQISVLNKAVNYVAVKVAADDDLPEEGGFYSFVLKAKPNLKFARRLLRGSGSRLSLALTNIASHEDSMKPATPKLGSRYASGSRQSIFVGKDGPGFKTIIDNGDGQQIDKNGFQIEESHFEFPEDEKFDDEVI
jgi:class 3 adenylate cyclase